MADVFISYSRKDQDFVRDLYEALEARGRDTWIDWMKIPLTAKWLEEVFSGIERADAFAFIISPDSVISEYCTLELAHAVKHNKRLVPVWYRYVDNKAVSADLASHQYICFRKSEDFENALETCFVCQKVASEHHFKSALESLIDAIAHDPDWVHKHTDLETGAVKWNSKGQDSSFALRGKDLEEAEAWLERGGEKEPKPTDLQKRYIRASREIADAAKAERRRQRVTLGAVAFGLIVAATLGLLAFWQWLEASNQKNINLGRQLASEARLVSNQGDNLLQTSVLLAVQAKQRLPSSGEADASSLEADQVLRGGLSLLRRPVASLDHGGGVNGVVFSPDGKYLVTASADKTARVWDAASGEEVARMDHDDAVNGVAFSPDGEYLATGSKDKTARVWDAVSGEEVVRVVHEDSVNGVTFSPDGRYLATTSNDTTARIWDAYSGDEVARMQHEDVVDGIAFSPGGEYLATTSNDVTPSSQDRTIRIWKTTSGKEVASITHEDSVNSVAFSPDGKYLATASRDRMAHVWDLTSGEEVGRYPHGLAVLRVAFSPDGRHLASSSRDKTARVWEIASGEEVARITHEADVNGVAFSPDGKYLATTSDDKTARVQLWQPEGLIDEACLYLTRNLTKKEWQEYVGGEPYHKTCANLPGPEE